MPIDTASMQTTPTTNTTIDVVATSRRGPSVLATVGVAALLGTALGALARLWMRLITDDPEFTWNGTIFIVLAFMLQAIGAGLAWRARQRARRRVGVTVARVAAAILTLGLFAGAGAAMLPTVLGASLATHRRDWPRPARVGAALLAVPIPMLLLLDAATRLLELRVAVGFTLMVLTYVAIVASLAPVVRPLHDGRRLRWWTKLFASVAGLAALLLVGALLLSIVSEGV